MAAWRSAQQRPLVTEDPETIGAGRILIEAGVDGEHEVCYPVSGLSAIGWSVPTLGVSIGLSSIAEIQIDGGLYQRLYDHGSAPAPLSASARRRRRQDHRRRGHRRRDQDPARVAKAAGRPAIGLRFATKLPNASNESGLGTRHDRFLRVAAGRQDRPVDPRRRQRRVAILGDPTAGVPEQNDLLTFGLSVARALTTAAELVAEINGRFNTGGRPPIPAPRTARVDAPRRPLHARPVRVDAGRAPRHDLARSRVGVTAGFTWVLNAFRVP